MHIVIIIIKLSESDILVFPDKIMISLNDNVQSSLNILFWKCMILLYGCLYRSFLRNYRYYTTILPKDKRY